MVPSSGWIFLFWESSIFALRPSTDHIKCTIYRFEFNYLSEKSLTWTCQRITIGNKCTIYGICYHVPEGGINIYAISFTFMSLEGKTRLTIFFFPIHVQCFMHAGCCYKMPEAEWFINHIIYHSSMLEVQDQGARIVGGVRASSRTYP